MVRWRLSLKGGGGGSSAVGPVTALLIDSTNGHTQARDEMLPLVYDELRRLTRAYMRRERSGHTLQPTELVHETYLRLVDQRRVNGKNRAQFVGLAAVMMRRILVNHARDRARRSKKLAGDSTASICPSSVRNKTTTLSACEKSGRHSTAWTTLKMAVFAPMPSANERITSTVTPGVRRSCRRP